MSQVFNPVQAILLDIEGTTSSISFVHDVMFPFVAERLADFLDHHFSQASVQEACEQIARDAGYHSLSEWNAVDPSATPQNLIQSEVRRLMSIDAKATGLKALQGLIWQGGFQSGELKAHVYPDVVPAIEAWREAGIDVRIYSSGSVAAQRLFFGHLDGAGDCLHLFSGHYDTTIGSKKESISYQRIAADWRIPPERILFVSDIAAELQAAVEAGMQVCGSQRPGNHPVDSSLDVPWATSFEQISQWVFSANKSSDGPA